MTKKIALLLHGFDGAPDLYFFPWLRRELQPFAEVVCPTLPDAGNPRPEEWIASVNAATGGRRIDLTIGHSLGGTLALSMLSRSLLETDCLMTFGTSHCPKDNESMNRFLSPPIELQRIQGKLPIYAFSSYDDPYTFHECSALLVRQLGAVGVFFHDQGHFLGDTLPVQAWNIIKQQVLGN